MLDKLRINESRKSTPVGMQAAAAAQAVQYSNVHDGRKVSMKKEVDINIESDASSAHDVDKSSGSDLFTPATESFDETVKVSNAEMERVRRELEAARSVINQQQRELEESRTFNHTVAQALPSPSEAEFPQSDAHVESLHR